VGLWRRREPLHERLAREGGLGGPPPLDPRPAQLETGIHGVHRPREWDAAVVTDAPGVEGDSARFVALPDGSLVVEDGEGDMTVLAEAIEREVDAPYRAIAVRRGEAQWAIAARGIDLAKLEGQEGDELELAIAGGERELRVDGERAFGSIRALEELAGGDAVVRASRIDGDLWEIRIDPL
jgi:hypothetical protein